MGRTGPGNRRARDFAILTLNSFSRSVAPGMASKCATLAMLPGSRTVPCTAWPAASRRRTMVPAR